MTMQSHGVNAEVLVSTIQVFIDMGKPFAKPMCPEGVPPTPAPNPAACSKPCDMGAPPGMCRIETGGMIICLPGVNNQCSAGQMFCASTPAPTPALPTPPPTPEPTIWANGGRRRTTAPPPSSTPTPATSTTTTALPPPTNYDKFQDAFCIDNEVRKRLTQWLQGSREEAAKACDKHSRCKGFHYRPSDGSYVLVSKVKKSTLDVNGPNECYRKAPTEGTTPPSTPSQSKCTTLKPIHKVWTEKRCQERCGDADKCVGSQGQCARMCSAACPCGGTR